MNDQKHPVAMLDPEGNEMERFSTIAQAARKTGYPKWLISKSVKGQRKNDMYKFKSLL